MPFALPTVRKNAVSDQSRDCHSAKAEAVTVGDRSIVAKLGVMAVAAVLLASGCAERRTLPPDPCTACLPTRTAPQGRPVGQSLLIPGRFQPSWSATIRP